MRNTARLAPYHVEHGYRPDQSTVFAIAAEAPHSVTDHQCNDPEGILDTICSAMSTIASNTAVLSGHCAVALGLEHARTIAKYGWTRNDIKSYLWMQSGNRFDGITRNHRYGKVYNRNLPKWYKRDPDSRIPIVESPGPDSSLRRRRACRALLGVYPRMGTHEHASVEAHHRDRSNLRRQMRWRPVQALSEGAHRATRKEPRSLCSIHVASWTST